jgi:hypothetical protein
MNVFVDQEIGVSGDHYDIRIIGILSALIGDMSVSLEIAATNFPFKFREFVQDFLDGSPRCAIKRLTFEIG